jgi:hypothetical protein
MKPLPADSPEQDQSELRRQLAELHGVDHVLTEEGTGDIWLILRADADSGWTREQAIGIADGAEIRLAYRPEHRDRQRVRFVEFKRQMQPDQRVSFSVTLEWSGTEYHGTAVGEKGEGVELRTAAAASLEAASSIVPGGIPIRLAGVKQLRAFDEDLVVVSLYRPDGEPHNLVGAVVTGGDSVRAAVVAVLSALNRLLGNYLLLP